MTKKIKKFVSKEEWYPVYELGETWEKEIEVTEVFLKKVEKVKKEFRKMQEKLGKLYNEAK